MAELRSSKIRWTVRTGGRHGKPGEREKAAKHEDLQE
jgi:hypothetical protein